MNEKYSGKSDATKMTCLINLRSGGQLSDATRFYRKEQALKKKLKAVIETNSQLQKQIKNHQSQIKDQRASVQFQLADLIKQTSLKFNFFTQQKLQKPEFANNQQAHKTLQNMMQKYQQIQKECQMMEKIFESVQKIRMDYRGHARDMEAMVVECQEANLQYQNSMEGIIHNLCQEIKMKINENQEIDNSTQNIIKQIDQYVDGLATLKEEQEKVMQKVEKLKKMACCQQQKMNQITQWAEIVIDKSNRRTVQKTMKEKQKYLHRMREKNNKLEIYLCQLNNEEETFKRAMRDKQIQKENMNRQKSVRKINKNNNKSTRKL